MSLFGIGDNPPEPGKSELDPVAKQMIADQLSQASRSPQDFAKELTQGLEQSVSRLKGSDLSDIGKTGVTPGFRDALRSAYSAQTGDALDRIKLNNQLVAEQRKANALQMASRFSLHQANMQTNYYQSLTDAYNQMEAQRAALVANISGLGAQAIGTYAGSQSKGVGTGNTSPDWSSRGTQQAAYYDARPGMLS